MDVFLSRDLDSRVSWREVFAVKEWLSTPATYHIMRDHPKHDIPMLGLFVFSPFPMSHLLEFNVLCEIFSSSRDLWGEIGR